MEGDGMIYGLCKTRHFAIILLPHLFLSLWIPKVVRWRLCNNLPNCFKLEFTRWLYVIFLGKKCSPHHFVVFLSSLSSLLSLKLLPRAFFLRKSFCQAGWKKLQTSRFRLLLQTSEHLWENCLLFSAGKKKKVERGEQKYAKVVIPPIGGKSLFAWKAPKTP